MSVHAYVWVFSSVIERCIARRMMCIHVYYVYVHIMYLVLCITAQNYSTIKCVDAYLYIGRVQLCVGQFETVYIPVVAVCSSVAMVFLSESKGFSNGAECL